MNTRSAPAFPPEAVITPTASGKEMANGLTSPPSPTHPLLHQMASSKALRSSTKRSVVLQQAVYPTQQTCWLFSRSVREKSEKCNAYGCRLTSKGVFTVPRVGPLSFLSCWLAAIGRCRPRRALSGLTLRVNGCLPRILRDMCM